MEEEKKRVNFSYVEKLFLRDLVGNYINILENKRSDTLAVEVKKRKWDEIANEFNSNPDCYKRTAEQLKKCWQNMKGSGSFSGTSTTSQDLELDSSLDNVFKIKVDDAVHMDTISPIHDEKLYELEEKKRVNFSYVERMFLRNLVGKYVNILENKRSDTVSVDAKKRKWVEMAEEFNCNPDCNKRTAEQLKKCWKNMKGSGSFSGTSTVSQDPELDSMLDNVVNIQVDDAVQTDSISLTFDEKIRELKTQEIEWRVKTAELVYRKAEEELERSKEERMLSIQKLQDEVNFKRKMYELELYQKQNKEYINI